VKVGEGVGEHGAGAVRALSAGSQRAIAAESAGSALEVPGAWRGEGVLAWRDGAKTGEAGATDWAAVVVG
jgi:hypothetical protein